MVFLHLGLKERKSDFYATKHFQSSLVSDMQQGKMFFRKTSRNNWCRMIYHLWHLVLVELNDTAQPWVHGRVLGRMTIPGDWHTHKPCCYISVTRPCLQIAYSICSPWSLLTQVYSAAKWIRPMARDVPRLYRLKHGQKTSGSVYGLPVCFDECEQHLVGLYY